MAMALDEIDYKVQRLYKYRPDNLHTLNILKNSELYFSFVEEFNDPFDCKVRLVLPTNREQWETHARNHNIPDILAQNVIRFLDTINYDTEKIMQEHEKSYFRTITVYCLSEIWDNILMWSHYSNSHKGLCIGFETIMDQNELCIRTDDATLNRHINPVYHRFLPVNKVKYQTICPEPYDFLSSDHSHLSEFFKTKSENWHYERERRIIMPYRDIKKRLISFDKSALKEIIFGCKASSEFMQQIMKLIEDEYTSKGHNVDILQCRIDRNEYRLNITQIN